MCAQILKFLRMASSKESISGATRFSTTKKEAKVAV